MPVIRHRDWCIPVGSGSHDPADLSTYYLGLSLTTPPESTSVAGGRVTFQQSGIIRGVFLDWTAGNATQTNENISIYIRKNDTTDYLLKTIGLAQAKLDFSNFDLNIPIVATDYVQIKMVYPTWATNPLGVRVGGVIIFSTSS